MKNNQMLVDRNQIEKIEFKGDKYIVKFPFLDIPVEVGSNFYEQHFEN